jgi:phospholipid N-methyltransferase
MIDFQAARLIPRPALRRARRVAARAAVAMRARPAFDFDAGLFVFWQALLRNPRGVGAAVPSSRRLAEAIAAAVPADGDDLVVEIGAGSGVVTGALLDRGIAPERLVVFERDRELARHLQRRYPGVRVISGDACHLRRTLGGGQAVGTIVSGVPLRSLPREEALALLRECAAALPAFGRLIQFTYAWDMPRLFAEAGFAHESRRFIALNLPPAFVDCWKKAG